MSMTLPRAAAVSIVLMVAGALALVLVPVDATYLEHVGSDTIGYRTASCGAPIASALGADPDLNGGSEHPIGGAMSEVACDAASGERIIAALVLLLAASLVWGVTRRRAPTSAAIAEPGSA